MVLNFKKTIIIKYNTGRICMLLNVFFIKYCHTTNWGLGWCCSCPEVTCSISSATKNTLAACKCVSHSSTQRKPHATCKQDVVSNLITYLSLDICAAIGNNFRLHAPPHLLPSPPPPCTLADMHVHTHFSFFSSPPSLLHSLLARPRQECGSSSSGLCLWKKVTLATPKRQ